MYARKLPIRLPRRITAYFLFFGIGALVWLSVGAFYVARSVSDSRSESASLRWLSRGSDRVVLAYLRNKSTNLQPVLAEICTQSGASYCAIVSPTGEYTAHSNSGFTGRPAVERGDSTDHWGAVVRVQYNDDNGALVHEYQTQIKAGDTDLGTFRLGIAQPNVWNYLNAGGQIAPLALLGPAFCMLAGTVVINRLVRPVADIEQQLVQVATSPSVEGCALREVHTTGAAAVGWNRVVKQRLSTPQSETLRQRVRQSLERGHNSRFDAVLNSIPDGVATTDAEGRLTYTNLPLAVLIGLKDVVGAGGASEAADDAPKIIDQLRKHYPLPETDPLLADENRDRPVVTEFSREENGERRVLRVARHPDLLFRRRPA